MLCTASLTTYTKFGSDTEVFTVNKKKLIYSCELNHLLYRRFLKLIAQIAVVGKYELPHEAENPYLRNLSTKKVPETKWL